MFGLVLCTSDSRGQDLSLPEQEVKARFLLHFAKYVEWPTRAFVNTEDPITICVLGDNNVAEELKKRIGDKAVNGRKIAVLSSTRDGDWSHCHILFISSSEKKYLTELVNQVKGLPVLTVGDGDQFTEQGGVIRFMKKSSMIRLEINLYAARRAHLQISSKLLSVADSVKGKQ